MRQIEYISLFANGVILAAMKYYAFNCIFKPAVKVVWLILAYCVFLLFTNALFFLVNNVWVTLTANIASYILLSFLFTGNRGVKITFAMLIFVSAILSEGLSFLILSNIFYIRYGYVLPAEDILPIGRSVTTIIHLPCILALILGYRKYINKKARHKTFKIPLRYTGIILFILCGITLVSAFLISATIDNIYGLLNQMIISQLVIALIIVSVIWLYNTILNHLENIEANKFKDIMLKRWEVQYQTAASSQKTISTLKHNMRFEYLSLASLLENGNIAEAKRDIIQKIGIIDSIVETGNSSIDTMLNYYQQKAQEHLNIDIELGLLIPKNLNLNASLTALILGNALENALDACWYISEEQRFIHVKAELTQLDELLITITNPYIIEPAFDDDGNLLTTKDDKSSHGLGLFSIREILPDEVGKMHYTYDKKTFKFLLLFYDVL